MKVGLISCTKSKHRMHAEAKKVYHKSNLFKKAFAYAEKNYDKVYIISAKHGLIEPSTVIGPYDVTVLKMSKEEKENWGREVASQIIVTIPRDSTLYFHMGVAYREAIIPKLGIKYEIEIPLAGLGIGKQLQWYNESRAN